MLPVIFQTKKQFGLYIKPLPNNKEFNWGVCVCVLEKKKPALFTKYYKQLHTQVIALLENVENISH